MAARVVRKSQSQRKDCNWALSENDSMVEDIAYQKVTN